MHLQVGRDLNHNQVMIWHELLSRCQNLQAEEKEVLESIYPNIISFIGPSVHIEIPIELAQTINLEVLPVSTPKFVAEQPSAAMPTTEEVAEKSAPLSQTFSPTGNPLPLSAIRSTISHQPLAQPQRSYRSTAPITLTSEGSPSHSQSKHSGFYSHGQAPLSSPSATANPRIPQTTSTIQVRTTVSTLPRIILDLELPPSYPLELPPMIKNVGSQFAWVNTSPTPAIGKGYGEELKEQLLRLWEGGDVVLFNWIEHIQSGKFLSELGLMDDDTLRISSLDPPSLANTLAHYDNESRARGFSDASFTCAICLSDYKGARCIQLSCSHVFCRSCLTDFWTLAVAEGNINKICCVHPDCMKQRRLTQDEEVRQLLPQVVYERWKLLHERRVAQLDPSVEYCPRCETPTWPSKDARQLPRGDHWSRHRTCHACSYNFCSHCLRLWHGAVQGCEINEDVIIQYQMFLSNHRAGHLQDAQDVKDAKVALAEIEAMEDIYGEDRLREALRKYLKLHPKNKTNFTVEFRAAELYAFNGLANKLSLRWITSFTRRCPKCDVRIWRDQGCNHMYCVICRTPFCYTCGEGLKKGQGWSNHSCPTYSTRPGQRRL